MSRRVAAIDCGTNSIRLLIADIDTERLRLSDLRRDMRIVRLGEGVDRTGRLAPAALDRTIAALREYAGEIGRLRPEAVRMVATSATRDAENADEFTSRVKDVLGVAPEVVTGEEEAWLSFTGATRELGVLPRGASPPLRPPSGGETPLTPPLPTYLVADIGGGSTEFVLGDPSGIVAARSVDIGCVRMTERHLSGDPPPFGEVAAAVADIDAALDLAASSVFPGGEPARSATLVGLAGSVTTVAGIALGLVAYDPARIHHSRVSAASVHAISADLLGMTREQRATIGVMHPGRVDVIGAGALILDRIMTRFGFTEVLVSEHDILDGIAWSLVGETGAAII
jgi:exopolyphosphatase / guanosine-5'-triphosphate,3'-diphosphate pyrophosphatase